MVVISTPSLRLLSAVDSVGPKSRCIAKSNSTSLSQTSAPRRVAAMAFSPLDEALEERLVGTNRAVRRGLVLRDRKITMVDRHQPVIGCSVATNKIKSDGAAHLQEWLVPPIH